MVALLHRCHDLAARLGTADAPVVLDVRWVLGGPPGIAGYREGHIPGAQFVDLDRELSAPPGPGRHPLPEPAAFEAAMRRHGVARDRGVVVYDAATGTSAARAWWTLRYFGHTDVTLLDGGFAAWVRAGLPVAAGDEPDPEPGDFVATPGHMPLLDAARAAEVARRGVLIDSRAPERFRGETEPVDPVAGHVPGARNLPAPQTVNADGTMRSPDELRARFKELGIGAETAVGVYCGSGVVASQGVLALAHAGIDAALYAGSWSEWISDPKRPVAVGE